MCGAYRHCQSERPIAEAYTSSKEKRWVSSNSKLNEFGRRLGHEKLTAGRGRPLVELALAIVRTTSMLLVGKWAGGGALRQ